jgi:hypothetical protein
VKIIDRQCLHDLVDQIPAERLPMAMTLSKALIDPNEDDEPVTAEDVQRMHEMRAALARGEKGTPMEEFIAEFGLKMEDFNVAKRR